jgi:uncharacterized membrane protein YsdA (DUF1294 family)
MSNRLEFRYGKIVMVALAIFPALAIYRVALTTEWTLILGYFLLVSALTYGFYWWDKRRAKTGKRRTREWTLHGLELIGGWPGAWLAQRNLRHKTAKRSYQLVFWLIVLIHQAVAYDVQRGGQWLSDLYF